MSKKIKKNEGPACACGRVDLYEEWLKTKKNKKDYSNERNSNKAKDKESNVEVTGK